ncbi:MAG TPA: HAMP domain-containing sensor histidine kinase [Ktedonobacteraceae bacterium]|nr:HAMP domain-containing sensor histidine kinase [Ktedonobacteraceae bacterium]
MPAKATSASSGRQPRSLRFRLLLWYGALLAIALAFFATLMLVIVANEIYSGVDNTINAESRIAMGDIQHELVSTPPYWPQQLTLHIANTYRDPGGVMMVIDSQGHTRYTSDDTSTANIPISKESRQEVLAGQTVWYTSVISGEHVRVEGLPIVLPSVSSGSTATPETITGMLLVARSLSNADNTIFLLRVLILLIGLATLTGTLFATWAIANRVLQPLAAISATARSIVASTARGTRPGDLSQRVSRPHGRDEMAQVVDTFNDMLASLQSATQVQRRFIADASHELRAPLTTIQGNLAFLQRHFDELPTDERRVMLSDAHGETIRLADLVDTLLLLARADASIDTTPALSEAPAYGANGQHRQFPVELDHVVVQLVGQLRRRLKAEGSKLTLNIGHIEPVRVQGDEENLRRVIVILLDNAIKYTPCTGEDARGNIIVSLERDDAQAILYIQDTGIGIAPQDLPHIFERFYRADPARSRQGTGLGLSIAQTLIEHVGGHISAESVPGQGSIFSIQLPLA